MIDILQELIKQEYNDYVWNLGITISKYSDGFQVDYWERRADKKVAQPNHHLGCFYPVGDFIKPVTDEDFETIHYATRLTCLAMNAIIRDVYDTVTDKK